MRQLRHRPFALSGVICFLFVMTGAPAMAAEPRLAPSASRKPVTLPVSLEGKRMATYGGGGLVVAEGDMAEPSVFSVYGANGNLLFHVPLKIPGASRVVVYDYSRTSTGILVACGFAESPGVQRAPYLTWFSADGSSQKVIRTDPYYPFLCAGAPDGSLWTVGLEMNADLQEKPEHRESPVLRRFAPDGRQLGAWLPRSSFPGSAELVRGFLVASKESWVVALVGRQRAGGSLRRDHTRRRNHFLSPETGSWIQSRHRGFQRHGAHGGRRRARRSGS
jgi:hypothetical protein